MNRKDKAFLKRISAELKRDAESIVLPDSLSTESIAELIKNNAGAVSPDEIYTAAAPDKGFKVLATPARKVLATAAVFVLIVASALVYRNLDRPVLGPEQSSEAGAQESGADTGNSETDIHASGGQTDGNKGDSDKKDPENKQGESAAEKYQIKVDGVKTASSYDEIENKIKKAYKKANSPGLFTNFFGLFATKNAVSDEGAPGNIAEESRSLGSTPGFGKTNEQVEGVSEADIIKNDGRYLYIFSNKGVQIVDTQDNSLKKTALIKLNDLIKANTSGESGSVYSYSKAFNDGYYGSDVRELYVLNNRLAAITSIYEPDYRENNSSTGKSVTKVTVFDISDKAAPKELLSYSQDGYYVSSRIYNGRLSLVTEYGIAYYGNDALLEETAVPKTDVNGASGRIAPDSILIPEDAPTTNYLVVGLIDKLEKGSKIDTKAVLGGAANIYSSGDNLLAARSIYSNEIAANIFNFGTTSMTTNSGKSEILAFSLKDGKVSLTARGLVDGTLLNQFSMDESNGYYRIATTDSKGNNVFVLDKELNVKGSVTGFAPGEQIKSVRFMGNTAYVVTFVQTDPLFVIDMSDPAKPVIRGELKIPGFSQYLHPIGNNLIIGIGRGGTETGVNNDAKISLFDVSDPTTPREIDAVSLKYSYIDTNHKAFLSVPERNMYVIPLRRALINGDVYYREIPGLTAFSVENRKIVIKDTYTFEETGSMIRGTYIGNVIFAIDPYYGVWAVNMDSKELIDNVIFN